MLAFSPTFCHKNSVVVLVFSSSSNVYGGHCLVLLGLNCFHKDFIYLNNSIMNYYNCPCLISILKHCQIEYMVTLWKNSKIMTS